MNNKPIMKGVHPTVRIVARRRLGLLGYRLVSSNQLSSNFFVSFSDSYSGRRS